MAGRKHIFQLLSANGDGTGTTNANGDYSSTPLSLKFKQSEKEVVFVTRMIVYVQDTGSFDSGSYGNGIDLANGIRVYHKNAAGELLEELTAFAVKSSGDWAGQCHDLNHFNFGSGDEFITVRWTFAKSGFPIKLKLHADEYIEVELNDDFRGLTKHYFKVDGFYPDEDL